MKRQKKKKAPPKARNPMARAISNARFGKRVIAPKTLYKRRPRIAKTSDGDT